jgi:uncharacterized lipoprotein YehR (DUF1307 family)
MNKINLSIIAVVLFFLVVGCGSAMKGKKLTESEIEKFHAQYNAKQFREIYSQSDDGFKKSVTESQLIEMLEKIDRKLGAVKKSSSSNWNVKTTNDGTFETITCEVEFAAGKGTEEFMFRIINDKARLYNYEVNSPDWNKK